MKRMLSATLISLAFLLSLSGCIVIPIYKNFDLDPETVSSVQISESTPTTLVATTRNGRT